ncbi:MAG: hypothetical protein M1826_006278 [Phylliscum demangeonii]|nr:MAG: hypothetical protein M1826_006278 [Phylliscum demangeonii]
MCRRVKLSFDTCGHNIRKNMRGWCKLTKLRPRRADGSFQSKCRKVHRLSFPGPCEICALYHSRKMVDDIRERLEIMERLAYRTGDDPDRFDKPAFDRTKEMVLVMAETYERYVTGYNNLVAKAFNRDCDDVYEDSDDGIEVDEEDLNSSDDERRLRPAEFPRLIELVYHDPDGWIRAFNERAWKVSRGRLYDTTVPLGQSRNPPPFLSARFYGPLDADGVPDLRYPPRY